MGAVQVQSSLFSFMERVQAELGPDSTTIDQDALRQAETATFQTSQRVASIVRPANSLQVQTVMRLANQYRFPIYPVSSGKNWGYGSRVPPTTDSVLLDLSRMKRIVDFSEELAFVTVEPGVTQSELHQYLASEASGLWMDATGSSPDCSIVGNVMERGFGHTPYGDHFQFVCGLQVVLPTGEIIETGYARYENSRIGSVNRWGVGPSLDGLFSQSNLGIVTRLSVWLMPKPEAFEAFFFRCEEEDGEQQLIDKLRPLRLNEVLRSSVHIGNDYKVLAGLQQYPWFDTGEATPITPTQMQAYRKKLAIGFWNASGALYGTPAQVAEAKRILRNALASVPGTLKFLNDRKLALAKRFARPFKLVSGWDLRKTVELVEPVLGLMKGVPTKQSLASAYWRKRIPAPSSPDPDRDRCGLLWYAPMAPADGKQVRELTTLAARILLKHKFEPLLSLTMITARSVACVVSISYDRDVAGEDEKALVCHEELARECEKSGFIPYRLGLKSMWQVQRADNYSQMITRVRQAMDPNGVLAPGRYE